MNKIFKFIILLLLVTSCQTVNDAFTLKKKPSGDEFLVEKKSPLVLPPDYGQLPIPGDQKIKVGNKISGSENKIFKDIDNNISITPKKENKNATSVEKTILKKIN